MRSIHPGIYKNLVLFLLLNLIWVAPVSALAQVIQSINVTGNRKIEGDAIKARISSKVGQKLDRATIHEDVLNIFEMGYFYDVVVDRSGTSSVSLTYKVVEKPSVAEIEFEGNVEINTDDLKEAAGIKSYEILDISLVQTSIEKMQKLYEEKGFFLAKVRYELVDLKRDDTVKLKYVVEENEKVKVKKITIIGNKSLPDSDLVSKMVVQDEGFFSFMSGSGQYRQDGFDRDVQVIRLIYYNNGFVNVKVSRPQVYISPDKRSIFITVAIEEGEQYNVGQVDFAGDILFPLNELNEAIKIKDSTIFAYDILQNDLGSLQALYGDLGYAYANIIPRTQIREKEKLVDITFEIDKGNKVYFGKFNVTGNEKTRDKVVRREMKIHEGELYNETRKRESIANVRRLGFFDEVAFNQKAGEGNPDVMDVDISVKERNTGSLQVGAGYGSQSNFIFNGRVQQANLFGKGQNLSLTVNHSQNEQVFNLSFTEPYFLDTEWSTGVDVYHQASSYLYYDEKKTGGALRLGHPLAPYLHGFVRYRNDITDIDPKDDFDDSIFDESSAEGRTSSTTFTLQYDKRNDRWAPTDGFYTSLSVEYAGLGGDKEYTEGFFNARYFQELFWGIVWRNNITYSKIQAPDGKEPPFNELYKLGGVNNLRGYRFASIGETVYSEKRDRDVVIGGTQQLFYNLEFQFSLVKEAGILGVTFFDIGTAADELDGAQFKSNVGFGVRWFSPIGPLRFEWGFPLDRDKGQGPSEFQFGIGAPF